MERHGILDTLADCEQFVENPSRTAFHKFQKLLLSSQAIAVAATFPAFFDPERFPMVDTRVAKWATECADQFNAADPSAPRLVKPPSYGRTTSTVLTMSDWNFVESWINWCRYMAERLTRLTGESWRARDVEMAVFCARDPRSPKSLNTLATADKAIRSRPPGEATGASGALTAE